MNPQEAADVIGTMADSIRTNPGQFQIAISVKGLQVTSHGGIGMVSSAVGGGPGSTTIGTKVSMDGAAVEIAQGKAQEAMQGQIDALLATLETIAGELRKQWPKQSTIELAYRSMVGTWVPGVITSVIGSLLSKAIGLIP